MNAPDRSASNTADVRWSQHRLQWQARPSRDGKLVDLGFHDTIEAAEAAVEVFHRDGTVPGPAPKVDPPSLYPKLERKPTAPAVVAEPEKLFCKCTRPLKHKGPCLGFRDKPAVPAAQPDPVHDAVTTEPGEPSEPPLPDAAPDDDAAPDLCRCGKPLGHTGRCPGHGAARPAGPTRPRRNAGQGDAWTDTVAVGDGPMAKMLLELDAARRVAVALGDLTPEASRRVLALILSHLPEED